MTRYIYSAEEAVQLLNETEKARASLALEAKDLRDQISDLNAENIELKKCLAEIEEREAACCPEDVAFDEQIVALTKLAAKKTVTIRLAPATQEQIAALAKFGGTSDVIAVAVDRLWQAEKPPKK